MIIKPSAETVGWREGLQSAAASYQAARQDAQSGAHRKYCGGRSGRHSWNGRFLPRTCRPLHVRAVRITPFRGSQTMLFCPAQKRAPPGMAESAGLKGLG